MNSSPPRTAYAGDLTLRLGDCLDVMRELNEASVDAIVTDPPYGLGFMGKDWDSPGGTGDFPMRRTDAANTVNTGVTRQGGRQRSCSDFVKRQARDARSYQEWCESWGREALRVLKPGGHALVFGGTRTYHRLTCGLEDAGFEIRDVLCWLYGSGFPKSLDVQKAIDAKLGVKGTYGEPKTPAHAEMLARGSARRGDKHPGWDRPWMDDPEASANAQLDYLPASDEARGWKGWGTALKPAHEPIVVARKSLIGTVAANVLKHGTGALNVNGCRIDLGDEYDPEKRQRQQRSDGAVRFASEGLIGTDISTYNPAGRWPANVVLDVEAADSLDEKSGHLESGNAGKEGHNRNQPPRENGGIYGGGKGLWKSPGPAGALYGDAGGASRFFYVAKADSGERNAGLTTPGLFSQDAPDKNVHPTVKPVDLMRWLCRLVTPPGGLILDPFMGSGTTGIAAGLEGFRFLGIEREEDYMRIAESRLSHWLTQTVEATV